MRSSERQIQTVLFFAVPAILAFLVSFAFSTPAQALQTIPYKMNFQGRLTDASGVPMAAGTYNMKFRIYDASSGGTLKWSEQRANSASTGVTVTAGGLFSVQLGDVSSLPANIFSTTDTATLYFEIELPTPATATCSTASCESYTEGPMNRNKLASSAYSFNSDLLDGLDSSAFAQTASNTTFTGTLGVNVSNAAAFTVGTGGTNILTVDTTSSQVKIGTADATTQVLVLDSNTADPGAVAGGMYYNSTSGKFRCYQGGWTDCITAAGGATLQSAYDTSSSPATITTTAAKGVKFIAGAPPTNDIFTIDNTGQAVTTAGVSGLQVTYVGGATTGESSAIRVDVAPGTTSSSTWNGMRIVANSTGAVSGVTENGIKLEGPSSPGAGTETGMYIGAGWDTGLDVQSGGLNLAGYANGGSPSDPPAPAADNLRVYAKKVSGRMLLKIKGPSGVDNPLQPALFGNNIIMYTPTSGTTVTGGFGTLWAKGSSGGTVSTPTPSRTAPAMSNQMHRTRHVNVVTTTNQAMGIRANAADAYQFWAGNSAGLGGYFFATRFILDVYPGPSVRLFAGLSATATEAVTSDTVGINTVGLWHKTTDSSTTVSIVTRAGSGTQSETAITLSNALAAGNSYDWFMFMKPNDTTVYYRLDDLVNGVTYEGSTTATLPANTAFMAPQVEMSNGIANTAVGTVGIGVNRIYIESDH